MDIGSESTYKGNVHSDQQPKLASFESSTSNHLVHVQGHPPWGQISHQVKNSFNKCLGLVRYFNLVIGANYSPIAAVFPKGPDFQELACSSVLGYWLSSFLMTRNLLTEDRL
jgi:hypothetical protein